MPTPRSNALNSQLKSRSPFGNLSLFWLQSAAENKSLRLSLPDTRQQLPHIPMEWSEQTPISALPTSHPSHHRGCLLLLFLRVHLALTWGVHPLHSVHCSSGHVTKEKQRKLIEPWQQQNCFVQNNPNLCFTFSELQSHQIPLASGIIFFCSHFLHFLLKRCAALCSLC